MNACRISEAFFNEFLESTGIRNRHLSRNVGSSSQESKEIINRFNVLTLGSLAQKCTGYSMWLVLPYLLCLTPRKAEGPAMHPPAQLVLLGYRRGQQLLSFELDSLILSLPVPP
eukprot:GHVT01034314.1.p1 GENE.GHVT01034314.1~~GHVT01034314.1.p1  ORF type:complete len:114 (-),score=3.03 GHVT01034314.1:2593-2934(-)